MTLFIGALVLVAVIGYLAQTIGLCMVKGVDQAAAGNPMFLLAILFCGVFTWVPVFIAHLLGLSVPFISFELTVVAIIGGLLFGLGAAFNNGCGVSTISKFARGQIAMLATIAGWLAGWVLLSTFVPTQRPARFQLAPEWHYGGLFVLSILVLLFVSHFSKNNKKVWGAMLVIGLMGSIVFLYEPRWTPSGMLRDVSLALWHSDYQSWPSTERFWLIGVLVGGMVVAALWARSFALEWSGWRILFKHLCAGVLMGVGAALASGGNDSQLLLSLPSLSPAGLVTVFSMLVGIYLGRKLV